MLYNYLSIIVIFLPSRVALDTSPPKFAALSVMLLRWARVVVNCMNRSLVNTPIMPLQYGTKINNSISEENNYNQMEKVIKD